MLQIYDHRQGSQAYQLKDESLTGYKEDLTHCDHPLPPSGKWAGLTSQWVSCQDNLQFIEGKPNRLGSTPPSSSPGMPDSSKPRYI